jgi:hypothetical protein
MNNFNMRFENPETKRYYLCIISRDLFNDWILTKIWGCIGQGGGRVMNVPCGSLARAEELAQDIAKARIRLGYLPCESTLHRSEACV